MYSDSENSYSSDERLSYHYSDRDSEELSVVSDESDSYRRAIQYTKIFETNWDEYVPEEGNDIPNVYGLLVDVPPQTADTTYPNADETQTVQPEKNDNLEPPNTTEAVTYSIKPKYLKHPYVKVGNIPEDKSLVKAEIGKVEFAYEHPAENPEEGIFQGFGIIQCQEDEVEAVITKNHNLKIKDIQATERNNLKKSEGDVKIPDVFRTITCTRMEPVPEIVKQGNATKEDAGDWAFFLRRNNSTPQPQSTKESKRVTAAKKDERKAMAVDQITQFYNQVAQGSTTACIYMIDFECATVISKEVALPCEVGIVRWNPLVGVVAKGGDEGVYHSIIHPGVVPTEYEDRLIFTSLVVTGIPFKNCKLLNTDYKQVWSDIQAFLGDPKDAILIQKGEGVVDQVAMYCIAKGAGYEGEMYEMIEYDTLFKAMGITSEKDIKAARHQQEPYKHNQTVKCQYHTSLLDLDNEPDFEPLSIHCALGDARIQLYGFNTVLAQHQAKLGISAPVLMPESLGARVSNEVEGCEDEGNANPDNTGNSSTS